MYELQTVMVHVNILVCYVYFLSISLLHVSTLIIVFMEIFNDIKKGSIQNFGWVFIFECYCVSLMISILNIEIRSNEL